MDIVINLLLWIHLLALVGGGAASVAMPIIGSKLPTAPPDLRASLFEIAGRLSMAGRGSLVVLIITGPLLFWLKWDFHAASEIWFGLKMLLLLILLVAMIVSGINMQKAKRGDMAALKTAALGGQVMGVALLGVVLAAVFAFN